MEVKTDSIHTVEEDDIHPPPHYEPDGPPQVVTADTARQGPLGRKALLVLVFSLLAVGAAWIALSMVY
jgi:hypothetical protein